MKEKKTASVLIITKINVEKKISQHIHSRNTIIKKND